MTSSPRRGAVLGAPISHSLSPQLHLAGYAALGLTDWGYAAIECESDGLAGVLAESGPDVIGYSCTMPLKRRALQIAAQVTPLARQIGAANTLLPLDGDSRGWLADNTDWIGVRDALAESDVSTTGSVVILGAGGTAQAALAALKEASAVTVLVRQPSRAGDLLAASQRLGRPVAVGQLSDLAAVEAADLVISTLPGVAADPLARVRWRADQALLDAVYQPWPTEIAAAVGAAGGVVVSGALMLLHQAARQLELMTGSKAPIEAMREALRRAAPGCGV